ncbi:hypothetical protein AB1Y20_014913 [Prymnesium parvum]|uniref:DNA polymerase n=1 Tax=Prymnesium parvum TaxID=97485 RepID=A0AB34JWB1_PRYPA
MESLASSRSRRQLGVSASKNALAQLAELKRNGLKRSAQFEVKTEADLYDDVDEATYQELVKKRREENFIEDDDGNGYVDFGQEDWDDAEYSGDESEQMAKRAKGTAARPKGVFNNLVPKPKKKATERVNGMFLGAGREVIGGAKAKVRMGDDGGEALLSSLLGDIEADPMGMKAAAVGKRSAYSASVSAARPALPTYRPTIIQPDGGISAAPRSEYGRAVPHFSLDEFDNDAGSPMPPPANVSKNGSSKRIESFDPEDIEAGGFGSMEADDQVEEKPVRTKLEVVEEQEDVSRPFVPFMTEQAASTGLDWFQVCEEEAVGISPKVEEPPPAADATASVSGMPPLEEDGSLNMFWIDAYEDVHSAPGSVFLFGKVKNTEGGFSSCCVAIKGLERNVFALPRERALEGGAEIGPEVSFVQLYQEVQALCRKHKISRFGCKRVDRSYAFEEPGIPQSASYLKLVYSAEFGTLPADLSGTYFRRLFGTHTSCLEQLLLKRRIMGPCWIQLRGVAPNAQSASWCKYEVSLPQGKKALSPLPDPPPSPPLVVASLHVQTMLNARHVPEILLASIITHSSVAADGATANPTQLSSFSAVRKIDGRAWPWDLQRTVQKDKRLKLEICMSERALLSFLIARLHSIDADVLVGHNIAGFDMTVLLQRLSACKIQHWSKIGRIRMKTMPKLSSSTSAFSGSSWAEWSVVAGRLMCDTYLSARELLSSQRSYGLKELAMTQLNANKPEIDQAAVPLMFDDTVQLLQLVRCCENDAFLSLQLMFKLMVLPLTKQLTNLAGNLWTKSLQGKRAERIEYLLLHEFHRLKYVVPDKETYQQRMAKKNAKALDNDDEAGDEEEEEQRRGIGQSGRKKPAYAGGLVLEPKKGFYDRYVFMLDFNSLYPSIVQEYNICYTTVTRPTPDMDGNMPMADVPPSSADAGVLPRLIGMLVARRREVRAILKQEKDPSRRTQLDIRQKALKIMANSMYGCLGFSGSRFYARALAELITARGRDALQHAVEIAGNNNMEVIYGDTDSVMVYSGRDDLMEARKMADTLKKEVNKHYKCMEIDIDGVMKSMLLLKKKKYAALMVEERNGELHTTRETKGLDLVRRDWCTLSREAGSAVLDFILSGLPREEVVSHIYEYLRGVNEKVQKNELGIEQYIITKALTKAPHEYTDAKNQPHVQVAKSMIEQGQSVAPGAVIEYVVCIDQGKSSVADRAYHPKTVLKAEGMLQIDTQWYLAQQLHPPIWRLCEPIEGMESSQVAECLGLDPGKFLTYNPTGTAEQSRDEMQLTASELQRFADAEPLFMRCNSCTQTLPLRGVIGHGNGATGSTEWLGGRALCCAQCGEKYSPPRLANTLALALRKHVARYYSAPLQCEEPSCRDTSRSLSTHIARDDAGRPHFPACTVPGCKGKMLKTHTDRRLHTQLLFLKSLFDVDWGIEKMQADAKRRGQLPPTFELPGELDQVLLEKLTNDVSKTLKTSAFNTVDFSNLFASVGI